jgi:L-rhamnonate dehydratase
LPIYATTAFPHKAKALGFCASKFPLPYGPADGDEGMRKNIEKVKEIRDSVGPNFPIMIDCYMSLTSAYATELARKIQPYNIKWMEECCHPDDYTGYAELKKNVQGSTLITCGEHEYTRYGFKQLLDMKCCDIIQPDITWVGGITEVRRIIALASAYDIPCIPHGSSVYSYHLQYAFPNCPIAECIMMAPQGDIIVPYFGKLFKDEPLPKDGWIELDGKKPGFGVTLNNDDNTFRRPYNRATSNKSMNSASK